MPNSTIPLAVAAFFVSIALTGTILACTIAGENLLPLVPFFLQLLAPLPIVLFGIQKQDEFGGEDKPPASAYFGWWVAGSILSVTVILPFLWLREGSMTAEQLGFTMGSLAIVVGVAVGLGWWHKKHREDYESF
eukprot:TRINITY_DN3797_c0_g1_i1.p1 TRINITY_DN3797_c0_g1~~TRINITY_DN3797_c0_g1_i1.p1  ORF type:complete len:134 (+),score=43.27 TRINITY_DN3797_c0_g1_i1:64-465(+)